MAGMLDQARDLLDRLRSSIGGEAHWVEPSNWITRLILSGELEPKPAGDLAPDHVVLSAPVTAQSTASGKVARAG